MKRRRPPKLMIKHMEDTFKAYFSSCMTCKIVRLTVLAIAFMRHTEKEKPHGGPHNIVLFLYKNTRFMICYA